MKRWRLMWLTIALALALAGCAKAPDPYEDITNPVATITMSDGSMMRFELFPQLAPNTVSNFVKLANDGFYDGQQFYRVVSNVFIQGGDPNNNGTGDPGYYIKGEFSENGYRGNTLSHVRGTISMARKSGYDTAGSQFFIMEGSYPEYDGYYAAFGSILDEESLKTLDDIGSMPVDGSYVPLDRVIISRIRVETYEVDYEPETLDKEAIDNPEGKKKK